jgi:hypothetical protein
MLVVKTYEDVIELAKKGEYVSFDLCNLNYLDYTKAIDFIKGLKIAFKRITRSRFTFLY